MAGVPVMTSVARRPFLTDEGEPLLMASDSLDVITRYQEFVAVTGIADQNILVDPVLTVPLPMYPQHFPEGLRRWEGTKPGLMWHPLMWLPERLQGRFSLSIVDEDGTSEEQPEPDDIWAIRVALELTESGLYDVSTGTWVDVLALVGLDSNSQETLDRVEAWLHGGPDDLLDSIDLSSFLMEDAEFALKEAAAAAFGLRRAQWALLSHDLLFKLDEAMSYDKTITRVQGLSTVAMLADSVLASGDDHGSPQQLWVDAIQVCQDAIDSPDMVLDEPVNALADALRNELRRVSAHNQEWLDQLNEDVPRSALGESPAG